MKTEARSLLLSLIAPKTAALADTTPEAAIDDAIHEAVLNQPVLRTCLYPGCIRQYDVMSCMAGDPPPRPQWSGEGWKKVTRGTAPGDVCPTHAGIVTTHLPRSIDLPNGKWDVHCACGWAPSRPQTYSGLLRPLWEEHLLTTTGALPAPPAASELFERIPLAEHTEATLKDLYELLEDTEWDRTETRDAAHAMYTAWDWHRQTLGGVTSAINAVRSMMQTSADFLDHRDWTADRIDAYLWAILIGWDDDALAEVSAKHRWDEHRLAYIRRMRGYLAPITDPQPVEGVTE